MSYRVEVGEMIIIVIKSILKKELAQKTLWIESYYSFKLPGDPIRALQSQSWGTKKYCTNQKNGGQENIIHAYRELEYIFRNVNSSSIRVLDQKLCLTEVGLPFLDSSNFMLTCDVISRALYFGGGWKMAYSKIYSKP